MKRVILSILLVGFVIGLTGCIKETNKNDNSNSNSINTSNKEIKSKTTNEKKESIKKADGNYVYMISEEKMRIDSSPSKYGNSYVTAEEAMKEYGHDIVIRHTIENDVIKESYVGFKKDGKMYYLKGSDTSVYNKNKEIIKELFGSGKCIDQGNIYMCNDDNVGVIARTDGSAEVRIDNQYCISYDNFAKCGNK